MRWQEEKRGTLEAKGKPQIEVSSPVEFKGHAGLWTPEDLLVSAVSSCTMLTFLSNVARAELRLVSYECDATGTLEMVDGKFRFSRIVLAPRIVIAHADDHDKTHAAFKKAEASCLVTNSLITTVEGEPQISIRG